MNLFVTGGSRGIGAAIVRAMLASGHDVAFTYVARADLADEQVAWAKQNFPDRRCHAYALDVKDSDAVERVVDQANEDLGGSDGAIVNAAINRSGLAASLSDEDWREVIDTNLSGTFFVCRQFLPAFIANKRGRFILISSIVAHGMTGQAAYAASKAGLSGLSQALAKEYGRKGITSNVLELGFFETDLTRAQMPEWARDFWFKFCPAGRMGEMNEVAGMVRYLVSDVGGFVNGATISLTGGLTWAP